MLGGAPVRGHWRPVAPWVATPVGLASEAALQGCDPIRGPFSFAFFCAFRRRLNPKDCADDGGHPDLVLSQFIAGTEAG